MSIEENVETVKRFLAALADRDKQGLLTLAAEDIEWITPGYARRELPSQSKVVRCTDLLRSAESSCVFS